MKKKHLECFLSNLKTFDEPKISLEQYSTSVELAGAILNAVFEDECLENRVVADLGCGCGVLLLGAAKMGASYCLGVEIDADALEICRRNIENSDSNCPIDLLHLDVTKLGNLVLPVIDTVIMNPPFGTKNNAGIDIQFVENAIKILNPDGVVFSLHKTSTRRFVAKKAKEWPNVMSKCVAELRWNLPRTYSHHKQHTVDIAVDLWKFMKVKS